MTSHISTPDEIETAREDLHRAEARCTELTNALQLLRRELPKAQAALDAARDRLRKLTAGRGRDTVRAAELQAITRKIEELRHVSD